MTRYRRRLRSRIIISFLLFGTTLTALFAVAVLVIRGYLEVDLIDATLERELNTWVEQMRRDPSGQEGIPFSRIEGFQFSQRRFANVPLAWRNLPDGVHALSELQPDGTLRHYKIAVRKDPDLWSFLRYDVTEERLSQRMMVVLLGVAVLAFAVLAGLLGAWSSMRVMAPVADLAGRLQRIARTGRHEPLSPHFVDDEVGQLAAALDDYAERLTALVERDREFNSDVSHELRTPLAVIQSATELLLAQDGLDERTRSRLQRIERAARQSTELTTALLHLSRAERQGPTDGETTDVAGLLEQVIEAQQLHLVNKPVEIRLHVDEPLAVAAPRAVIAVALGNLIGNACKYTSEGEVTIHCGDGRVIVEDTGPGIAADELGRVFERHFRGSQAGGKGSGLGLAIVRRLCELYRWQVRIGPREEGGLRAELVFTPGG